MNLFLPQEYDRALEYINLLLSAEGDNHQALDLKELIEKRMNRGFINISLILICSILCIPSDGLLGLALTVGFGGVAVLGVAAAAILARKK
jgi:hypothetical protein